MVASGSTLYLSGWHGILAIWKWNGSCLESASIQVDPTSMVASGSTLYVTDFAAMPVSGNGMVVPGVSLIRSVPASMVASVRRCMADCQAGYGLWKWDGGLPGVSLIQLIRQAW